MDNFLKEILDLFFSNDEILNDNITFETDITSYGYSSFEIMEIVEQVFNVYVPYDKHYAVKTVGDILKIVKEYKIN